MNNVGSPSRNPSSQRYTPHPPLSPGRQQLHPLEHSLKPSSSATTSPRNSQTSLWAAAPATPTSDAAYLAKCAPDQHPISCGASVGHSDNIKVAVRVRPLFPAEQEKGCSSVLAVSDDSQKLKVVVGGPAGATMQRDFSFHACLGPEVGQEEVLRLCGINQLLDAALSGYNVTVFAYGQTGSGKTYTMSGREEGCDGEAPHDGIVLRGVKYLFQQAAARQDAKWSISASYLEIYNEGIFDLLHFNCKGLPVKWDAAQGFYVPGLKTVACSGVKSMIDVLQTGAHNRRVGSHELNMESSRSHAMITIHCNATPTDPNSYDYGTVRYGKVCFVDLAGSERLKDSKCEGSMLKETTNINKSLFVLGKVISALSDQAANGNAGTHIPYRDSKLTKLLMDSLGGSALALMIACISPSSMHVEETLSTLSYATRAKNIQNRPIVQHDPKEAQISLLRREIELLRQENAHLREQLQLRPLPAPSGSQLSLPATPDMEHGAWALVNADLPAKPQTAGTHSTPRAMLDSQRSASLDSAAGAERSSWEAPGGGAGSLLAAAAVPGMPSPGRTSRLGTTLNSQVTAAAARSSLADETPLGREELAGGLRVMSQPMLSRPPELLHAAHAARTGAAASNAADTELLRRLRNTEVLLGRFSEENSRLARENDRLRVGRQLLGSDQASMLDEIEMLRGQLGSLENAVLADTPGVREAALAIASGMRELGAGLDYQLTLEGDGGPLLSRSTSHLSASLPSGGSRSGAISPQAGGAYAFGREGGVPAGRTGGSVLGAMAMAATPPSTMPRNAAAGSDAFYASPFGVASQGSSRQGTGSGKLPGPGNTGTSVPGTPQVISTVHGSRKPSVLPAKGDNRERGGVIVADHAKLLLLLGGAEEDRVAAPTPGGWQQAAGHQGAAAAMLVPSSPPVSHPAVKEALGSSARRTSYVELERARKEMSSNGNVPQR